MLIVDPARHIDPAKDWFYNGAEDSYVFPAKVFAERFIRGDGGPLWTSAVCGMRGVRDMTIRGVARSMAIRNMAIRDMTIRGMTIRNMAARAGLAVRPARIVLPCKIGNIKTAAAGVHMRGIRI